MMEIAIIGSLQTGKSVSRKEKPECTIIIALLLLGILSPKSSIQKRKAQKRKHRQDNKPWYDVTYEDIILYDLIDDE